MLNAETIKKYLTEPRLIGLAFLGLPPARLIPDKQFIKLQYKWMFGKPLNLEAPVTYNEKIQWLKLYDRRAEYLPMVDKFSAKRYAAGIIGEEYIIPTIGVWDRVEDIDFDLLPNEFVLKCTHDSGGLVICKDKNSLDVKNAQSILKRCLKRNYYWHGREWAYKNVKPRVIAEKLMNDGTNGDLRDYKIFCFDGEPRAIEVDFGRFTNHKRNLYNTKWELLPGKIRYDNETSCEYPKPDQLEEMLYLARTLSKGYPHIRTDFYLIQGKVYFGELTLYHGSGLDPFYPESFGKQFGDWLRLPERMQ